MSLEKRVQTLANLRNYLDYIVKNELDDLLLGCSRENAWFTKESIQLSIEGIVFMLTGNKIEKWVSSYSISNELSHKKVGLVLAGNLPLVGFHDLICVYLTGHSSLIKVSHQDEYLIKRVVEKIKELDSSAQLEIVEKLAGMDAVIATGSDNSARYFEYYFGKYPHIIRKNRTSIAILNGDETENELIDLGKDVLQFFGLGCRNVSKLLIPEGYDLVRLGDLWTTYSAIGNHHKFANNYDYNKSIYLINRIDHLDYGYLLLKKDEGLVSPISVLFYEFYSDEQNAVSNYEANKDKIQCVVSSMDIIQDKVTFGQAQKPELWDYADGVDTVAFLVGV